MESRGLSGGAERKQEEKSQCLFVAVTVADFCPTEKSSLLPNSLSPQELKVLSLLTDKSEEAQKGINHILFQKLSGTNSHLLLLLSR